MTLPLTPKQHQLLTFIASCELSPTFEEMKSAVGVKSKSGVFRLVNALEDRGFIRRIPGRQRAIEVIVEPLLPIGPTPLSHYTTAQLLAELQRRDERENEALARDWRPKAVKAVGPRDDRWSA